MEDSYFICEWKRFLCNFSGKKAGIGRNWRLQKIDNVETMCYNLVTSLKEVLEMADAKTMALSYKGRPLRRKGNLIYYGSMSDKYIIMFQVLATKKVGDLDVATRVGIQLQLTAAELKGRDRIVKKGERGNLYAAMDLGSVWLERQLARG